MSNCMCCDKELTRDDQGSMIHRGCGTEWNRRRDAMECVVCGDKLGKNGHPNMDCVRSTFRGYPG